ncbi:hypothetical protein [Streptomyces fuscigenes]|uniref:hypothetical protein n=1 Tax=Streptomyces fuscigenes TaxID=1528880 RepID=UPI001F1D8401|nr:hypothetical protein [Streptomyces fuscigenes]MCF3963128.1 hypothetical protein [Streptomyces fuscigenes]
MVRNVIGGIIALAGAASAVLGPFLSWYNGRDGRDYRLSELFEAQGVTSAGTGVWASLVAPFAFAALVTLIGLVLRSRTLITFAGLVVLGFTVLWMVRQGQAAGSLAIEGDGSGLGQGVAYSAGGGIALLLAAAVMSGRRRRAEPVRQTDDQGPDSYGYGYGYGDEGPHDGPGGYDGGARDGRDHGRGGPDRYGS